MATYEEIREQIDVFTNSFGKKPRAVIIGRHDYDDIRMKASLVATVKNVPKVDKIADVKLWIVPGRGYLIVDEKEYVDMLDRSRALQQ